MSSPLAREQPPSLLDLPTELRIEIYQYLFESGDVLHNPWFGLFLASKQLHAEIGDLLKYATLRVRIQPSLFHRSLAQKLQPTALYYPETRQDPLERVGNFQAYCLRFRSVVFDITATQNPTDCRLQPSYEKKGQELANALTAELVTSTPQLGNGTLFEIKWGSFNRNVYKGITTWDCCVLKGLGSMMALQLARDGALTGVLTCALLLEEGHRRGLAEPLSAIPLRVLDGVSRAGSFKHNLANKFRRAIQSRA